MKLGIFLIKVRGIRSGRSEVYDPEWTIRSGRPEVDDPKDENFTLIFDGRK